MTPGDIGGLMFLGTICLCMLGMVGVACYNHARSGQTWF